MTRKGETMTNAQINNAFLKATDSKTSGGILDSIAEHYGITQTEAKAEVTHDDAEHLLDYMVGPVRAAAHVIMKRYGLSR